MDLLITLETYSLQPNAAVAQITTSLFDLDSGEIQDPYVDNINPNTENDLHFDIGTINWWNNQEDYKKDAISNNVKPLLDVVNDIKLLDNMHNIRNIWCNTSFDVPILMNLFNYCNIDGINMYKFKDINTLLYMANIPMYKKEHYYKKDIANILELMYKAYNKIKRGEL